MTLTADYISLKDALNEIYSGNIFEAVVCKCDIQKKRGGNSERIRGKITQAGKLHFHDTINVFLCHGEVVTAMIRKIHPILIMEFNGKIVLP